MNENRNSIEIDLRRIFFVLLTRLWIIILAAAILGAAAFGYSRTLPTTYSASVQLYVNNNYYDDPGYSSSQLDAANKLADTYIVILRSRAVLKEIKAYTCLHYEVSQLRSMLSAAPVDETEIFQVTVTCTNAEHARIIANAVAEVLPGMSPRIVPGSTMTVVDHAEDQAIRVGPSHRKYIMIGALIGALLAAVILVILELLDTTIHTEEYLDAAYQDVPLLAVLPGAETAKGSNYKGYYRGYYAADKKPAEKKAAPDAASKKSGGEQ